VLHLAARFPPGVVLLGLVTRGRAPAESDRQAALIPRLIPRLIAGLGAQRKPVLVTNSDVDERATAAAVVAGAVGVIPRSATFETLVDALAGTAAGRPVMTEAELRYWYGRHRDHERRRGRFAQLVCRLSPREREVLDQLPQGCRAVDIASRSMVSISTVRAQIRTILATLEVSTQLEAVALLAGVTRPPSSAQPEARREVNGVGRPIATRRCC
jgi:DNA-binding NarL/FixJ family response regulator